MTAMTALAATALILTIAAWARPQTATRQGREVARARRRGRGRASPPTPDEWAALLDSISNEVRTGSSLTTALQRALVRSQPHGRVLTPTATLATIAGGAGTTGADEAVAVQALRAAHALGGPIAATLDAAAGLLRERAVIRCEALAFSAQARLSARILTGVPLVFAGWSVVSSRTFRTAVASTPGVASVLTGAVCNLLGWWWMRRIVARAVV